MRLDKFLKVSRLIKRRTLAKEVATQGRISVNEKVAKPGTVVKVGDKVSVLFGENRMLTARIERISETARKEDAMKMYTILSDVKQIDGDDEE